jgi:hypothetical protein
MHIKMRRTSSEMAIRSSNHKETDDADRKAKSKCNKRRRRSVAASTFARAIRKRVREKDDPIWMKKRTYVDEKRELLEMRDLMSTGKCFKDEIRFFIWFF